KFDVTAPTFQFRASDEAPCLRFYGRTDLVWRKLLEVASRIDLTGRTDRRKQSSHKLTRFVEHLGDLKRSYLPIPREIPSYRTSQTFGPWIPPHRRSWRDILP